MYIVEKAVWKAYRLEEEGFEPPVELLQLLFSKQTHSATLPLFRKCHFAGNKDI